jgi:hypothetical protein
MTFLVQRIGGSVEQQTTELQAETTRSLSEKVARDLVVAKQAAADIGSATAAMRSAGVMDRASYDSVLQNVLAENPQLLATWSAWEPNALCRCDTLGRERTLRALLAARWRAVSTGNADRL